MPRLTLVAFLLAAAGCSHARTAPASTEAPPVAPPQPAVAIAAPTPAPVQSVTACSGDDGCGPRQLCVEKRCADIAPGLAACGATVHFGFDSHDLAAADLPALQRLARCAAAGAAPRWTIEGDADERGTSEYNLALGDKRASAVAAYLERLGVARGQLRTVSYGKERPVCSEHTEACWAENRRAAAAPGSAQ